MGGETKEEEKEKGAGGDGGTEEKMKRRNKEEEEETVCSSLMGFYLLSAINWEPVEDMFANNHCRGAEASCIRVQVPEEVALPSLLPVHRPKHPPGHRCYLCPASSSDELLVMGPTARLAVFPGNTMSLCLEWSPAHFATYRTTAP
ncbi:hypothetical protein H920_08200 [Fukomys damarensis]|uniref:Uncharacterized protein n=1 Tax=Fukomys damarensis TaxID=885580 RepID=A0A091DJB8_FUKDA|nr:hypothetical protein H920_08200 [Fukomys damarensis]